MSPRASNYVDAICQRAEKYGLSLVLLVMILVWAKPHADDLIRGHSEFLKKAEVMMERQADTSAKQSELQAIGILRLDTIQEHSVESNTILREMRAKILAEKQRIEHDATVRTAE